MLDQLASFLFTVGVPRPAGGNPDLRAQALALVDAPSRLRASWTGILRHLQEEGFEAGEFALICRLHLNFLDNCAILLEVFGASAGLLGLSLEKVRNAAAETKSLQDEIQPICELATRKPPPLDPAKLLSAQKKHAGTPAVEVGELLRRVQAGEVEL